MAQFSPNFLWTCGVPARTAASDLTTQLSACARRAQGGVKVTSVADSKDAHGVSLKNKYGGRKGQGGVAWFASLGESQSGGPG